MHVGADFLRSKGLVCEDVPREAGHRVVCGRTYAQVMDDTEDLVAFDDDEIVRALDSARGLDRQWLLIGLSFSVGTTGVPVLLDVVENAGLTFEPNAISSLFARGVNGTPYFVRALRFRNLDVQDTALGRLAKVGSAEAGPAIFAWLLRRLKNKNRANRWGGHELPLVVMFAVRHQQHGVLAAVLVENWERLQPEEVEWLNEMWPALAKVRKGAGEVADIGPPERVEPGKQNMFLTDLTPAQEAVQTEKVLQNVRVVLRRHSK